MDIHLIQFLAFTASVNYIQTVWINENMLANKVYMRIFTHYQHFRWIFLILKWIAYWVILYLAYLFYKRYWFSIDFFFIMLFALNISLFLRSCLRDLLYISFYIYPPVIIGLLFFISSGTIIHMSSALFYLIFVWIFILQAFIDNKYIKKEIDYNIWIKEAINPETDFSEQQIQDDIIETIILNHPYYWVTQLKYAFWKIYKKN